MSANTPALGALPLKDPARHAPSCTIETTDFQDFLRKTPTGSVDLMLTDPPYAISRKTGFQSVGKRGVERFAVSMDFGAWDQDEIDLRALCDESYRVLRKGGTAIVFYDLWKISHLAEAMIEAGYKQLRLIEWQKTNPVPLNSKRNYLTNSREVAVLGVKVGKPIFNGEYDAGVYSYPIPNNGKRFHPTQKPLELFRDLVKKHSEEGARVIDPFIGSGTTALATLGLGRRFKGCDKDEHYAQIARERVHAL